VRRWKAVGEIEDNDPEASGNEIDGEEGVFVRSGVEGVDLE